MPYLLEIDHSAKFIRNTYNGVITKEDLRQVWTQMLGLKEFTLLQYNLLSDYRNSNFNIDKTENNKMIEFLLSIKDILNKKKEAAILNNPKDTALSMMLQFEVYKRIGYSVQLFSTEDAAIKWLNK